MRNCKVTASRRARVRQHPSGRGQPRRGRRHPSRGSHRRIQPRQSRHSATEYRRAWPKLKSTALVLVENEGWRQPVCHPAREVSGFRGATPSGGPRVCRFLRSGGAVLSPRPALTATGGFCGAESGTTGAGAEDGGGASFDRDSRSPGRTMLLQTTMMSSRRVF